MDASGALDLPGLSLLPASSSAPRRVSEAAIRELIVPGVGGRRVFRILVAGACRHECDLCPMAAQRELGPHGEPKRLARAFVAAWRRGWCDGVFVTAGVPKSATWAMEKLLEVVETLRFTLGFRGYVHVKIPAGADRRQLERMMALVDRVSFQLEPACRTAEAEAGCPETPVAPVADPRNSSAGTLSPEITSQRTAAQAPARRRDSRTRKVAARGDLRVHPLGSSRLGGLAARVGAALRPRPARSRAAQPDLFGAGVSSANRL